MADPNVTTPEVEPTKTLADYEKILGVGKDYTPESVLKTFEVSYWVKQENKELDTINIEIAAKNALMQHLVSMQMKAQRYFDITAPFENSCIACRGTGEIYKFKRKTVKVNCHICAGKRKVKVKCPTCEGSGKYLENWEEGGGLKIDCNRCNGKKEVFAKCEECNGKGKKKKMVHDHELKSTTPCKHCHQVGFTENKPSIKKKKKERPGRQQKAPSNPVLSADLALKIKESFQSDTEA